MNQDSPENALTRFFSGISEYVFQTRLGVADVPLIDYVSDLLCRFSRTETMHRVRQLNGRPATEVVAMLAEARSRIGEAKRDVHRHIGDFTLFWTGLYPEALRELQAPDKKDQFVSYCAQGKYAYHIASSIESRRADAPCEVLRRLSEQFEMCAYGLREIRREWEARDSHDGNGEGVWLIT